MGTEFDLITDSELPPDNDVESEIPHLVSDCIRFIAFVFFFFFSFFLLSFKTVSFFLFFFLSFFLSFLLYPQHKTEKTIKKSRAFFESVAFAQKPFKF